MSMLKLFELKLALDKHENEEIRRETHFKFTEGTNNNKFSKSNGFSSKYFIENLIIYIIL